MKVLIIEDDQKLADLYKAALLQIGAQAEVQQNGLEAIASIGDIKPDVVMLDLLMPELDGFDFLKALNDNVSVNTCVIVVTNVTDDASIKRAKDLGVAGYLKKVEYTPKELINEALNIYRKSLL